MKREEPSAAPAFLGARLPVGAVIAITACAMALLIACVTLFNIPNPNMILISGLVISASLFGYPGGGMAGAIMALYTLYFFSTENSFVRFTPVNLVKVCVSFIGILAVMLFVCALKRREMLAFRRIEALTEALRQDNKALKQASLTDGLTGLRNRHALRMDTPYYEGRDLLVMMMDMNDFKTVNDRYGHKQGDHILARTGELLAEAFGQNHCYRYGGDEFLVICPGMDEAECAARMQGVFQARPALEGVDGAQRPGYSYGCVRRRAAGGETLKQMIDDADERMYRMKQDQHKSAQ